MCMGRFGRSNNDLLCVQSLNCSLTIFEAEQALFTRSLPTALLPGPIAYASYSESIVTTSGGVLSSIKYNSLVSSASGTHGKKLTADWTFTLGDWPIDVGTVGSSTLQPSVVVLCKRTLYCFTQGGVLRFSIRLQCIATYLMLYGCGGSETYLRFCVVATRTLLFYAHNVLIWTANLQLEPTCLKLCTLSTNYRSMLAILSTDRLSISYLGTEPSLFCLPASQTRFLDFKERQLELQRLEAKIRRKPVDEEPGTQEAAPLEIQCSFKSVHEESVDTFSGEGKGLSLVIDVDVKSSASLKDTRLLCHTQFEAQKYLVIGGDSVHFSTAFSLLVKPSAVSDLRCQFFAISTSKGEVASCQVKIPLSQLCRVVAAQRSAQYKLTFESVDAYLSISELFPGLKSNTSTSIAFQPMFAENSVSIFTSSKSKRYRIQSDSIALICLFAEELISRIKETDQAANFKCQHLLDLSIQTLYSFLELEQRKSREETDLECACVQLRGAQAALLQKLKAPRPASVSHLNTLMEYSYDQIMLCVEHLTMTERQLNSAKVSLSASLNFLHYYMSLIGKPFPVDGHIISTTGQLTTDRLKWLLSTIAPVDPNKELNKTDLRNIFYKLCEMPAPQMEDISEEEYEDEEYEPEQTADDIATLLDTVVSGTIPLQQSFE